MCITLGDAQLSNTVLTGFQKNSLHTVIYSCQVASEEKNSLVVWVPTLENFSLKNILDLSKSKLNDSLRATVEKSKALYQTRSGSALNYKLEIGIVGNWMVAVAVAGTPQQIKDALCAVPEEMRPEVGEEMLRFLCSLNRPLILACHTPVDGPMDEFGYFFQPENPSELLLPALDGHGEVPRDLKVNRDHLYIVSVPDIQGNLLELDVTEYLEKNPHMEELLPYELVGERKYLRFDWDEVSGLTPNGDVKFNIEVLRSLKPNKYRYVFPV